MEQRTAKQIQEALAKPFAAGDLEWRLQKAYPQEMRGIAVPYVTNRAIQYRLDDVVGVENWYNRFKPWHRLKKIGVFLALRKSRIIFLFSLDTFG